MKKEGFTLVELLGVIIVLGIILAISIPSVFTLIKSSSTQAFIVDTKKVIEAIGNERLKNINFDVTTITETNIINEPIELDNNNYATITTSLIDDQVHVTIVGKNEWDGLTSCGTIDKVIVVTTGEECNN